MPRTTDSTSVTRDPDWHWLRRKRRKRMPDDAPVVRVVDLFCGCGGMTLGVSAAAEKLGARVEVALAADMNSDAVAVYGANFGKDVVKDGDVSEMFNGTADEPDTLEEAALKKGLGRIDVLVGGPPCQGHSDLNNHTRRDDPRNELYMVMARAARVLEPKVVVIENVSAVRWDRRGVVARTIALLAPDYDVVNDTIALNDLGVPQKRKRHILLAVRREPGLPTAEEALAAARNSKAGARDLRWAISDLVDKVDTSDFDTASTMTDENKRRARWLMKNKHKTPDLPDSERPPCHRDKAHSYKSVYGRLEWHKPAQTITTGFGSMGQGRYIHPDFPRTITPHEAARIQTFPDFFSFSATKSRGAWARLIGNAVPALSMERIVSAVLPAVLEVRSKKQQSRTAAKRFERGRDLAATRG